MKDLDMKYLDFVVTVVKAKMKLTKSQMRFAYEIGFITMGWPEIEAAQFSLDFDEVLNF